MLELTVGQKLQTAVIVLALGVAGYLFFANSHPVFDHTVNSWTQVRKFTVDSKSRFDKDKNPWDPKKEQDVTVFASTDGQVDFIESPNDPDKHLQIAFRPDLRQANKVFLYYQDPMAMLAQIKDPFKHALTYAVYFKLYRPEQYEKMPAATRSLLGQIQPTMSKEQYDKEGEARKNMDAGNAVIDGLVAAGTFHSELIDPLVKALKEYQANSKDVTTDAAKGELGRKVLTLAEAFDKKIHEEKAAVIDRQYITPMGTILTDEQKDSLIAVVAKREQKVISTANTGRRGNRAGGTNPPARGAARGAATTPARGGRAGRGAATPAAGPTPTAPEAATAPGK